MASSRNSPHCLCSLLVAILLPIAGYAASIASSQENCPVKENHCTCVFNGSFYNLRCASLRGVDDFKTVVANLSENAAILEVNAVHWDYLPLDALVNSSMHTFIVGNSSFRRLENSSEAFSMVENLRHLSLENVTFHQNIQWKQLSSLKHLEMLFVYNTTVPRVINSRFSQHLSKNLKSISIAESNISSIERGSFKDFKFLESLRITHSKLATFSRNILPKPSALEQLRLDYNKIHSLPVGVFENLPNLSLISLSNNSLSTLPQDVFSPLWNNNIHLELRGNPLKCDCRLLWIVTSETKPQELIGQCAFPKRLFGKNIKDLTEQDLNC